MDTRLAIVISLTLYKITSLTVGLFLTYMGYKLFTKGIWGKAGNLEAQFGDNKLLLKKAAPGTFFALFGTVIICVTVYKGLEFYEQGVSPSLTPSAAEQSQRHGLPSEPPRLLDKRGE